MPVENPDGSSGIDLHIVGVTYLNRSARFNDENFTALLTEWYDTWYPASKQGVYHLVMVVEYADDRDVETTANAETPGKFVIISDEVDHGRASVLLVHELLHNVLGQLEVERRCTEDPIHYCDGGWLSPTPLTGGGVAFPDDRYLPGPLAAVLERDGFAQSPTINESDYPETPR